MRNLTTELKVGLLLLAGLSTIIYASVVVTGWRPGQSDTYTVYVYFDNVAGLLEGAPVQVAGVKIGQVERIGLADGRARVGLAVYRSQPLPADSAVAIKSLGILGDKYVSVQPGSAREQLRDGDTIVRTLPGGDLDSLVDSLTDVLSDIKSVTASLRQTLGGEEGGQRLDGIMEDIARSTRDISRITDATNKEIDAILAGLRGFSENLNRITAENRSGLQNTVDNLEDLTGNLERITAQNEEDIRTTMNNLAQLSGDLARITADNEEGLSRTVDNLSSLTENLDEITGENREDLRRLFNNLAGFSEDLQNLTAQNREALQRVVDNLDTFSRALGEDGPAITKDLREMLAENKRGISQSVDNLNRSLGKLDTTMTNLESVTAKIERGEGSIGKLVNDETTVDELNDALAGLNRFLTDAERIRLDLGGHTEYLVDQQDFKSYFTVRLQPLKDRYYMLQLVDNPRGRVEERTITREVDGRTTTEERTTVTDELQLNLLIAQRYYDTELRGGLIENTFGVGVHQYFGQTDAYRIGLDVWDFGRDTGAHVKATAYWRFFSNAFLVMGGDDLANENTEFRDAFFGVGVTFNEDTLKPMASSLPINSLSGG